MKTASKPAPHSGRRKRPEAESATVFRGSALPAWIYDAGSLCLLDVNEAALDACGYSRAEILSMRLTELGGNGQAHDGTKSRSSKGPAEKPPGPGELRRKDGSLLKVEITTRPVEYDGRRAVLATMTPLGPVPEQAPTEAQYRDLFDNTQALIGTHDLQGNLLSINPWAAHVLGYEPEEVVGRNIGELLAPEAALGFP